MVNQNQSIYYWASWRRVLPLTIFFGILVMIGFYLDGMHSISDVFRGLLLALGIVAFSSLVLGATFIRIKGDRVHYTSSLFEWYSMDIEEIKAITLVPRFFFTDKVTAVLIEKKNPGIFPGFLLSRDAFPAAKIVAIVSHLHRLNPLIILDEGVQKILEAQKTEL